MKNSLHKSNTTLLNTALIVGALFSASAYAGTCPNAPDITFEAGNGGSPGRYVADSGWSSLESYANPLPLPMNRLLSVSIMFETERTQQIDDQVRQLEQQPGQPTPELEAQIASLLAEKNTLLSTAQVELESAQRTGGQVGDAWKLSCSYFNPAAASSYGVVTMRALTSSYPSGNNWTPASMGYTCTPGSAHNPTDCSFGIPPTTPPIPVLPVLPLPGTSTSPFDALTQ